MKVLPAVSHCVSRQQGYSCSSLVCTAVASSLVCSINESIITSTTMLPFHKVLRAVSVTVCLGSKGCSAGQPPLLVGQPPLLVGQRQADGCSLRSPRPHGRRRRGRGARLMASAGASSDTPAAALPSSAACSCSLTATGLSCSPPHLRCRLPLSICADASLLRM